MKNIKKIIAFTLMLVMISAISVSSFAAEYSSANGSKYVFEIKADKTEVKVGDTVKVSFYVYGENGEEVSFPNDASCFRIAYDSSSFTYKDAQAIDSTETCVNSNGNIIYTVEGKNVSSSSTAPFFYVNFTAIAEGNKTFSIVEDVSSIGATAFYYEPIAEYNEGKVAPAISVTVKAGSTDKNLAEETFTDEQDGTLTNESMTSGNVIVGDKTIEMGENGKIYTYFKKTVKALNAGEYGITATINGQTYKFPGNANVSENGKWAIKLIVPNGTFSDGTTTVGEITNATPYGID